MIIVLTKLNANTHGETSYYLKVKQVITSLHYIF